MTAQFISSELIVRNGVHALGGSSVSWCEVKPGTVDELIALFALSKQAGQDSKAGSERYALFPGRLDLNALVAERQNIFIDFSAFTAVREHVASDLVIACETGLTLAQLNEHLSAFSQRFPVELGARAGEVTLLDLLLAGDGGYLESGFGYLRSQILGLESVYADGLVLKSGGRVVKNVTGFDVTKLVIGSKGAFAFPYLAYLRLAAVPEAVASFSVRSKSNDPSELLAVSARLLSTGLPLSTLELVEVVKKPTNENEYQLIVQVEGPGQLVDDLSSQIGRELSAFKFTKIDNSEAQEILTYAIAASTDFSVEVAASLSLLRELLENLPAKQRGRLRVRPASGRLFLQSGSAEQVDSDLEQLAAILVTCRQRGDGSALSSWETLTVAARYGLFVSRSKRFNGLNLSSLNLYQRVKATFDPAGCLNPQANFEG
ncbi:FAD-binding oxidoreductase [soil metagenome]